MPKLIVMDIRYVTFSAPRGLSEREYRAVSRSIAGPDFTKQLKKAIVGVTHARPALKQIRIQIDH